MSSVREIFHSVEEDKMQAIKRGPKGGFFGALEPRNFCRGARSPKTLST